MVKHTQKIRRPMFKANNKDTERRRPGVFIVNFELLPTNCLIVFDQCVGLALKLKNILTLCTFFFSLMKTLYFHFIRIFL